MSETITYADFIALIKDTVTQATAEACLKQAVRAINLEGLVYNVTLTQFTGSPLSGSYTSDEVGGIFQVAMAVYSQNYKNSGSSNSSSNSNGLGGISESESTSSSNSVSSSATSVVAAIAHDVVMRLRTKTFVPPIFVANDYS